MCYSVPNDAVAPVSEGSNATIQMEYWSSDEGSSNGKNESFYACADVV